MRIRTVFFDLDGTLIDHLRAIHRCHSHALRQLGRPEPTMEQVRAAIGGGLELAIERLAGREAVAAVLPLFLEHWEQTQLDDVEAMPGAHELLKALGAAGVRSAVLTNKRGDSARKVCRHLGLEPHLAAVCGAHDTPWFKPAPQFTQHVLALLGAAAGTTVLVGDSPFDVQTAQQAELGFIGVTTGTHTAEELRAAGATRICAGLPEVQAQLEVM